MEMKKCEAGQSGPRGVLDAQHTEGEASVGETARPSSILGCCDPIRSAATSGKFHPASFTLHPIKVERIVAPSFAWNTDV